MSSFFAKYPDFTPKPSLTPEANFSALSKRKSWSTEEHTKNHHDFLLAFLADNPASPVHAFFINYCSTYPTYNPDLSPHTSFSAFLTAAGRSAKSKTSKFLKREFLVAFNKQFCSKVDTFFNSFHLTTGFCYNPYAGAVGELQRLRKHQSWNKKTWGRIEKRFREAFESEFNSLFGEHDGDKIGWQRLCEVLEVLPMPASVTQCKKRLEHIHVNIFDVVEKWRGQRKELTKFPTVKALAKYSIKEHKIFPRDEAKRAGALKFCLRQLFRSL